MIQFLTPLFQPVGFVWFLLLLLAAWLLRKKQRRAAAGALAIAAVISLFGSTMLASRLLASLEEPYARSGQTAANIADLPPADAVVMLGGAHRPSKFGAFGLDLTVAGDRAITALEILRQKKAGVLVLGGNGYLQKGEKRVDAELLQQWFAAWHLSDAPVMNLGINANTHDEALKAAALAREHGWQRVILVTSACHMRRAEGLFRKLGVPVIPVACDFQAYDGGGVEPLTYDVSPFPRIEGFSKLSVYLHETLGWIVYRWRGWLGGEPLVTSAATNFPPAAAPRK